MSLQLNRIYNIDCLKGMRMLEDNSIDLTVTSPPYDNLRTYNGYSFNFENIAKELFRVTKEGGVVVWVVGDKTIKGSESGTSFKQALYFKEIGFNLWDTMIYAKNNPIPTGGNRYGQQFEYMFVLSKGKPKKFNPIKVKCVKEGQNKAISTRKANGERDNYKECIVADSKKKHNIWFYSIGNFCSTKDKIAFKHPAIFPEKLAEDHILSWSDENDVVMDIFMGSGTTAKMCMLNKRNYIGFEISQEYIDIANNRIHDYID